MKNKYSVRICALAIATGLLLGGCGSEAANTKNDVTTEEISETTTEESTSETVTEPTAEPVVAETVQEEFPDFETDNSNTYPNEITLSAYVDGYDWGAGVSKVILEFSEIPDLSGLDTQSFKVKTDVRERSIVAVYYSDERGNETEEETNCVTLELYVNSSNCRSPLISGKEDQYYWKDSYEVSVESIPLTIAENTYSCIAVTQDCADNFICVTDDFNTGTYSGTYLNPLKQVEEEQSLTWSAYEPESISGGSKNPVLIWLHGAGEGGTETDAAWLGSSEVTALTEEEIQSYFTSEEESGAYVLVVQTPTYWLDEGDGKIGNGAYDSRYLNILMDTIREYCENVNEDIDLNRIYLGGCSNGGYMVVDLLINYPEYFAAAYPVCEVYAYNKDASSAERWLTDEKIQAIKDTPIWFVQSADDRMVNPSLYGMPTYQALLQAGAKNCWYSMFETVVGTDEVKSYEGHYSWIYLLNNQVTNVQDTEAIMASTNTKSFGFTPDNNGGGEYKASVDGVEYTDIFEWMNAQSNN